MGDSSWYALEHLAFEPEGKICDSICAIWFGASLWLRSSLGSQCASCSGDEEFILPPSTSRYQWAGLWVEKGWFILLNGYIGRLNTKKFQSESEGSFQVMRDMDSMVSAHILPFFNGRASIVKYPIFFKKVYGTVWWSENLLLMILQIAGLLCWMVSTGIRRMI